MVGGGLSLKKSIALTFKLLKKSKSENDNRNWYPTPGAPLPFVARHPDEIGYEDPRGFDKLKFTSFLGDQNPEPVSPNELSSRDHASVSQYLSAIRELNGKSEPIFIFSEQPLDGEEIIEHAQKSIEFSNPMYQSLAECLSGLSPELEEERIKMNGESIHYQVVVSNMPVYLDEKIYANLDREIRDEPLYAVSDVVRDPEEIYANIELPIEPIIRTRQKEMGKDIFETVLYCTLSNNVKADGTALPGESPSLEKTDSDLFDSGTHPGSPNSKISETNRSCLTPNPNQITIGDKGDDFHSLITNKAAKTAFMQKLDSQLRSHIKKRVKFAVPEYTAYSLEAYSSVEASSIKQSVPEQCSIPSIEEQKTEQKLDQEVSVVIEDSFDSVNENISEIEQVSAELLLEMLESVPELPKPDFRLDDENLPPLPISPPPLKLKGDVPPPIPTKNPPPKAMSNIANNSDKAPADSLEEIVDAMNDVDFRIAEDSSVVEQVKESEVIYFEPEMVKPPSGIFRASVVETYSSDDSSAQNTPSKQRRNMGEIIAEDHERAVKKKLDSLVDKPDVTVYDLGVHQVEKQRNQLIKQQKMMVRKTSDWVPTNGESPSKPSVKSASAIPDSLKPRGWKSPEPRAIRSPARGEVIAESIIQQKDGTKKFWEDKMIAARQDETLSPPPGFDDTRAETPVSQTSSGSILLVEVPDDSYVSVGDLLPEEEPKKDYMYHDAVERDEKSMNSYEESESLIEIAKNTNNPTETFIEREIRMQKDREKQIQSEREVAIRNVSLPGRPTSATLPKLSRPVSKPNSDFPRPEKHKTAEALISQEMEDLKRREEELKWRQNMLGSHGSRENLLNDDQFASITTTDEGHYSDNDAASDERESRGETPQPNNLHKSHSMESLSSGHSSGEIPSYNPTSNVTTDSKRRRVVVKPFDDSDEQTTVPAFKRDQKETPIEREIRLARDREEELRRDRGEKGLPVWASQPVKKEVRVPKEASQDQNRGVQLRMATSRIQAEIQEVSDKEKELRSAGKLQTTSEETVDSKVQRPSHLAEYSSELRQAREVKRSQLSRAVSTPQLNVEPENPRLPTLTRGFSTQVPPAKNPFVAKKASAPPAGGTQRGLMQKFINSRGKATSVSISSPEPPEVVLVKSNPVKASLVLNPVVVEKLSNKEIQEPNVSPTAVTQKPAAPRRHYLTAEEKIQEEMREMQRREEELRLQRVKSFSRSQPDLNGFDDGEPSLSNSENGAFESTENEANEDPDTVIRRPSHSVNAIQNAVKNQRRKSHLIAEWENRIMQN